MAFNILRIVLQKACKMNNSFGPDISRTAKHKSTGTVYGLLTVFLRIVEV